MIKSVDLRDFQSDLTPRRRSSLKPHSVWYRQDRLEGVLVSKLREAMTPPIVDALTRAANAHLDDAEREHDERGGMLKAEILKLEREAGNLVRFLAGGESFSVRAELESIEGALHGLRVEAADLESAAASASATRRC